MSRTLHLFGTDWCAMMVPIQVIRWYRMQCYDGTDSCATVVPIRRYCQFNALTVKDVNRFILTDNYLFWFAKTLKATLQRLSGKTTFEFVSVKKVGNILIPIPPFQEQQRIVAQIEKLFEQLR